MQCGTENEGDTSRYLGYSNVQWAEGDYSRSPDQRWALYLITGSADNQTYSNIFVFDTIIYPELKNKESKPTKFHMNNPKAQFFVPVRFSARESETTWDVQNNCATIKYGALKYRIDLKTFSFLRIE
jgi:hypothetical protein